MRTSLLVAGLDLRRRLRDRSVVVTALVAPVALASVLGFAFGSSHGTLVRLGVVDLDRTARSAAVVLAGTRAAAFPSQVAVVPVASEDLLRSMVSGGELGGGVIVPVGFGAATASPEASAAGIAAALAPAAPGPSQTATPKSAAVVGIVYPRNSTIAAEVTAELAAAIDGRVAAGRLAAVSAGDSGSAGSLAVRAAEIPPPVVVVDDTLAKRRNPIGYFGPSMAIIFLFIGAGAGARSLLAERQSGTLSRLGVAPVTPAAVMAGKVAAVAITALASLLAVWAVTTVAFSATWGTPGAVLAMCLATVVAFTGIALFITVAAKEPAQAETATLVLGFGLALFGGNFFPPGALPPLFEKLTLVTPNGWALQGFGSLALDGSGFGTVVPPLIVLCIIGVVFGAVAVGRLPKALAA